MDGQGTHSAYLQLRPSDAPVNPTTVNSMRGDGGTHLTPQTQIPMHTTVCPPTTAEGVYHGGGPSLYHQLHDPRFYQQFHPYPTHPVLGAPQRHVSSPGHLQMPGGTMESFTDCSESNLHRTLPPMYPHTANQANMLQTMMRGAGYPQPLPSVTMMTGFPQKSAGQSDNSLNRGVVPQGNFGLSEELGSDLLRYSFPPVSRGMGDRLQPPSRVVGDDFCGSHPMLHYQRTDASTLQGIPPHGATKPPVEGSDQLLNLSDQQISDPVQEPGGNFQGNLWSSRLGIGTNIVVPDATRDTHGVFTPGEASNRNNPASNRGSPSAPWVDHPVSQAMTSPLGRDVQHVPSDPSGTVHFLGSFASSSHQIASDILQGYPSSSSGVVNSEKGAEEVLHTPCRSGVGSDFPGNTDPLQDNRRVIQEIDSTDSEEHLGLFPSSRNDMVDGKSPPEWVTPIKSEGSVQDDVETDQEIYTTASASATNIDMLSRESETGNETVTAIKIEVDIGENCCESNQEDNSNNPEDISQPLPNSQRVGEDFARTVIDDFSSRDGAGCADSISVDDTSMWTPGVTQEMDLFRSGETSLPAPRVEEDESHSLSHENDCAGSSTEEAGLLEIHREEQRNVDDCIPMNVSQCASGSQSYEGASARRGISPPEGIQEKGLNHVPANTSGHVCSRNQEEVDSEDVLPGDPQMDGDDRSQGGTIFVVAPNEEPSLQGNLMGNQQGDGGDSSKSDNPQSVGPLEKEANSEDVLRECGRNGDDYSGRDKFRTDETNKTIDIQSIPLGNQQDNGDFLPKDNIQENIQNNSRNVHREDRQADQEVMEDDSKDIIVIAVPPERDASPPVTEVEESPTVVKEIPIQPRPLTTLSPRKLRPRRKRKDLQGSLSAADKVPCSQPGSTSNPTPRKLMPKPDASGGISLREPPSDSDDEDDDPNGKNLANLIAVYASPMCLLTLGSQEADTLMTLPRCIYATYHVTIPSDIGEKTLTIHNAPVWIENNVMTVPDFTLGPNAPGQGGNGAPSYPVGAAKKKASVQQKTENSLRTLPATFKIFLPGDKKGVTFQAPVGVRDGNLIFGNQSLMKPLAMVGDPSTPGNTGVGMVNTIETQPLVPKGETTTLLISSGPLVKPGIVNTVITQSIAPKQGPISPLVGAGPIVELGSTRPLSPIIIRPNILPKSGETRPSRKRKGSASKRPKERSLSPVQATRDFEPWLTEGSMPYYTDQENVVDNKPGGSAMCGLSRREVPKMYAIVNHSTLGRVAFHCGKGAATPVPATSPTQAIEGEECTPITPRPYIAAGQEFPAVNQAKTEAPQKSGRRPKRDGTQKPKRVNNRRYQIYNLNQSRPTATEAVSECVGKALKPAGGTIRRTADGFTVIKDPQKKGVRKGIPWLEMVKVFSCRMCPQSFTTLLGVCRHLLGEHGEYTKLLMEHLSNRRVPDSQTNETLLDLASRNHKALRACPTPVPHRTSVASGEALTNKTPVADTISATSRETRANRLNRIPAADDTMAIGTTPVSFSSGLADFEGEATRYVAERYGSLYGFDRMDGALSSQGMIEQMFRDKDRVFEVEQDRSQKSSGFPGVSNDRTYDPARCSSGVTHERIPGESIRASWVSGVVMPGAVEHEQSTNQSSREGQAPKLGAHQGSGTTGGGVNMHEKQHPRNTLSVNSQYLLYVDPGSQDSIHGVALSGAVINERSSEQASCGGESLERGACDGVNTHGRQHSRDNLSADSGNPLSEEDRRQEEVFLQMGQELLPILHQFLNISTECPKCGLKVSMMRFTALHSCVRTSKSALCELCGLITSFCALRHHYQQVHSVARPGTERCKHCNKEISKKGMHNHVQRVHTDAAKVTCVFCNATLTSRQHLRRHERIHRRVTPYKCPHCHRSFNQRTNLKTHMRQHTGERPYKCDDPECGKSFVHKVSLKTHLKKHHGIDLWKEGHTGGGRPKRGEVSG